MTCSQKATIIRAFRFFEYSHHANYLSPGLANRNFCTFMVAEVECYCLSFLYGYCLYVYRHKSDLCLAVFHAYKGWLASVGL